MRLRGLPFVLRTDVRGYYASIDPVKLVERLACAHAEHAERFLARAMRLRRRAAE